MTNLIGTIFQEILSDDADQEEQSEKLYDLYEAQDEKGQKLIDDALICICGWGMESLLNK